MKKWLIPVLALLFAGPALAQSTINPAVPAANSAISSAPIRNNFAAAYTDVTNILQMFKSATAPPAPLQFQQWANTTTNPVSLRVYDGAQWVAWGSLNTSTHTFASSPGTASANTVMAGPTSGGAAAAAFRALVSADLPLPTLTTFGAVQAKAAVASNWLRSLGTDGILTVSQPAFTDVSGSLACAQHPALTGDVSTSAGSCATAIGTNVVQNTMLRQGTALSVVGNSTSGTANVADIAASSDNSVLRRSGTALAFGSLDLSQSNTVGASLLGVPNGGTGIASGTSGGIPYYSGTTTIASSAALTASRIVLGGGAGVAPTIVGSLGTTTTVLHGNAAGAPTFGAVSLSADVTGSLPLTSLAAQAANTVVANVTGGSAVPTAATVTAVLDTINAVQGSILYRNVSAWVALAAGTSGQVLQTQGAGANPQWAATTGVGTVTSVTCGTGLSGGVITSSGTCAADIPLRGVQVFTTGSGTYTPTAGTRSIIVYVTGGGGGGGGSNGAAAGNGGGGGGGGGATAVKYIASAGSVSYTVGAAGTAGVSGGGGNGGNGGQSAFTTTTANGGTGGTGATSNAVFAGGAGSSTTANGTYTIPGSAGTAGWGNTGSSGGTIVGGGGGSVWGVGPPGGVVTSGDNNGTTAVVPGAGGSGSYSSASDGTGGAGAPGLIVVYEF